MLWCFPVFVISCMDVIFNFQFFVEQAASCKTVRDSMDQGVNKPIQSKPTNVCSQVLQHLVPISQAQAPLQQQLSLAKHTQQHSQSHSLMLQVQLAATEAVQMQQNQVLAHQHHQQATLQQQGMVHQSSSKGIRMIFFPRLPHVSLTVSLVLPVKENFLFIQSHNNRIPLMFVRSTFALNSALVCAISWQ